MDRPDITRRDAGSRCLATPILTASPHTPSSLSADFAENLAQGSLARRTRRAATAGRTWAPRRRPSRRSQSATQPPYTPAIGISKRGNIE